MNKLAGMLLFCAALLGCNDQPAPENSAPLKKNGPTDEVVIIGTNPDYPPMEMIDPDSGRIVGFSIDLMQHIAEEGGFRIEWKNVEWKGIFGALERDDIDAIMSSATITDERRKKYDFSDPYFTISQRVVVQTKDAGAVTAIPDLDGKRIGVQLGTTGALLAEKEYPKWQTATYDNSSTAFADLLAGSVFGFMVDEPVAEAYSRANPQTADKLTALPFVFSEEYYGIVVRKNEPELLAKINKGLAAVKEKGIDTELRAKWLK